MSDLVGRAERNRAEMSRLQAERAVLCADALQLVARRVAQREAAHPGRDFGDTIPLREIVAELAAALRVGERTIHTWIGDGALLVGTFPTTLDALRAGRIDERHASAIIDEGAPLDPDHRAEFEQLILPLAESMTAPELREHAAVIAARLQPDLVDRRHRDALTRRQVRAYALPDGLARLLIDAPAALVNGIYDRVTQLASAISAPSFDASADPAGETPPPVDDAGEELPDERTLDQRRADVACDLLLTGGPTAGGPTAGDTGLDAIRATVRVTIPILTLADLDDTPAVLDGYGPIDVDTARTLAAAAPCWQRIMIHPITEEPLRLDTYRPSKRLRRLLHARDRCCRWPGCRRPAVRTDIDHTIAFAEGGPTCAGNLELLCAHHHTLKHATPWQVVQLGGGTLEFISPTRRRYRNNAPPVVEAVTAQPWRHLIDAPYSAADPAPF